MIGVQCTTACNFSLQIADTANAQLALATDSVPAGFYFTSVARAVLVPVAAVTVKVRCIVNAGTASVITPFWLVVTDYGPI